MRIQCPNCGETHLLSGDEQEVRCTCGTTIELDYSPSTPKLATSAKPIRPSSNTLPQPIKVKGLQIKVSGSVWLWFILTVVILVLAIIRMFGEGLNANISCGLLVFIGIFIVFLLCELAQLLVKIHNKL